MDFWARMAALVAERDLLTHPMYVRWSQGELTREELAGFAGQYRHALVALATASSSAARVTTGELQDHFVGNAGDLVERIERWDEFVASLDLGPDAVAEPSPAALACAREWTGRGRSTAATLAFLYAIDREAAASHREFLELEVAAGADHDELLDAASAALDAGWRLLDSVDRLPAAA